MASVILALYTCLCSAGVPRTLQLADRQVYSHIDCDAPFTPDLLGLSPGSEAFLESDDDFGRRSIRWTDYMRPGYSIVVQPAAVEDVQKLVGYAGRCGVPFLGTSAQHGFDTNLAKIQNGLAIDLSKFRSVDVNKTQSTMTVGGGVRFLDVYDPLFAAGKESNTGASACVGLISPSIGGGVGRLQGVRGLMVDSLRSAQLVIANGSVVTVSATSNSDLFWAVRGAGANFGIVVEATFEVYDLTSPMVASTDLIFSPADAPAIIQFLQAFGDHAPERLGIILTGAYQTGSLKLVMNAVYHGPISELDQILSPLLATTKPLAKRDVVVPWNRLIYEVFFGLSDPSPEASCGNKSKLRTVYGAGLDRYNVGIIVKFLKALAQFYDTYPGARESMFFIQHFSQQKVQQVPEDETAYPWRDITSHVLWTFTFNDTSIAEPVNNFVRGWRDIFTSNSGFTKPHLYVNYGHGDEPSETLYGASKLPKLRRLKALWDPRNLFRYHHNFR